MINLEKLSICILVHVFPLDSLYRPEYLSYRRKVSSGSAMLQVHNLGLFITVNSHCKVSGLLKTKRQYEWRSLSYDGTFLSRWCHFFYNENVLIYRVREITKCKMMCTINYAFTVSWSHPSWTPMENPRGIMSSKSKHKIKEL